MENTNTQVSEQVSTKCVFIYPSENVNCGIIPDENGLIFHFGESKELYPPKHIKILVNEKIEKIEIAKALRKLADILEGKAEVKYEQWLIEQSNQE
jgi:hypothetical protein